LKKTNITLIDGTETDNCSKEYQRYCEALSLSRKPLEKRREWLNKLRDEQRVEQLKYWLKLIWQNKST